MYWYCTHLSVTEGALFVNVPVEEFLPLTVPLGATEGVLGSVTSINGGHCVLVGLDLKDELVMVRDHTPVAKYTLSLSISAGGLD